MPTPDFAVGVAEISTTTGTGAYALGGALPGASTLASRITDGGTVNYRATDGARQEVGQGVFDAETNTLSRATITYPASAVDWGTGRRLISVEPGDNLAAFSPVSSVSGRTGNVILSSVDLSDFDLSGAADKYFAAYNNATSEWTARSPTQATALLVAFVGDGGIGGTKGLVPAPASGDAAAGKVLGAGGAWVSRTLAALSDVTIASPAASDVLAYDTGTSKWVNRPLAAADLSDGTTGSSGAVVLAAGPTISDLIAEGATLFGDASAWTGSANEIGMSKMASASGTAPGAGVAKFAVVPGTTAGSAKLIAYAGTSTTPSVIADNIGSGF